ncbi:MAG: HAD-IIIC family phosphatase, partial [Steroidobacteraceae bacterium]
MASHVVNRLGEIRGSRRVETLAAFPPFMRATASAADAGEPRTAFEVAVAGSFTIDPLLPGLRFWMDALRLQGEVQVAPYGQLVQTLLDPAGAFASPGRGLNLALLCVGDWIRELPAADAASPERVRAHLERAVIDFDRAMRTHRARGGRPTLLMVCPTGALAAEIAQLIARAEDEVVARATGLAGLQVVRCGAHHDRYGVAEGDVHDPLRDRIGHIPYRDEYFHVLATIAMRHARRRIAPAYKVVVVDADNTLWRGVVGEVGADGVAFDAQHHALHRTLVRLSQSGVVIAICSKNEESDVWEVFDTRSDFGLRREHIVGAAINWQSKSQNLRALASRLNLGLDSLIFLDDNPVECAEVRAHCPEVLTLEWPQDPDTAIRLLEHTWELDTESATSEDRRRTEMYREELQRRELREGALTLREFLDSLDLHVDISPLAEEDLRRASQLTLRTNQFNFTTRRREEADMQALLAAGRHEIRTVRVRDRFGDYGLVG